MGDEFDTLVSTVKEMHRNNQAAKDLWAQYTKEKGGGTRDPNRHTAEFLQGYVQMVQMGETMPDTGGMGGMSGMGMGAMGGFGGELGSTGGGGGGDASAFAQQIKELQKGNPQAREAWVNFANSQGGGALDPNRHPAEFLQQFLMQLQGGGGGGGGGFSAMKASGGGGGGGCGGGAPGGGAMLTCIKQMQKKSQTFRGAWGQFCQNFGGGRADPAKHPEDFHLQFIDALAQQACLNAGMGGADGVAAPMGGPAAQSPMMGAADNPAKRARMDSFSAGGTPAPDSKEYLVAQVKEFQKMGPDQKELWCAYVDTYLSGTRDPNRHDASILSEFCSNHGVPPPTNPGSGGGGGGGASMGAAMATAWAPSMGGGGGGGGAAVVQDAEQQELCSRVKAFQKISIENREAWYAVCGHTKDPSRHDKAKLEEFCMTHGI